ncbi:MAG: cation-translocating P-type ATPase [Anaerolineales bacterium]|nr:cation-translocating P-type ATPase [Anaerolineales bacterium]
MEPTKTAEAKSTPWHKQSLSEVQALLDTNAKSGLREPEIASRVAIYGPNELVEQGRKSPLRILWEQFTSTMVLILIAAAVLSALLGKSTETVAITAIVLLFGLLGFVQEYRAEQAIAALKKLSIPNVRTRRAGEIIEVPAPALVPGDVVLLEAGNLVPADLRLSESINLRIEEAALTGESEPVEKETRALAGESIPLGDRKNLAYMGTVVTYGRGAGIVVETGMNTELGKIASLIQGIKTETTPLQRQLDRVGKGLAVLGIAVAVLILIIGILSGESLEEMLLTAISVAVAVVPEGLPAVVTVTLALGAQRMLRRNALVRKLPAVETLGSVTVICSDKTGTLTENRMTVTVIDVAGHFLELQGTGLRAHPAPALRPGTAAAGAFLLDHQPPAVRLSLVIGALCNDASMAPDPKTGRYIPVGDPTEGALLVATSQAGLDKAQLEKALPRRSELPFDSDRKRMTTVHAVNKEATTSRINLGGIDTPYLALTKGAVDGMLAIATCVWVDHQMVELDEEWMRRIQAANDQMAQQGMRVLGLALRPLTDVPTDLESDLERDIVFVGMVGMIDPPRPEVKRAVEIAKRAGMRPIMITGDHPLTARFIAYELGISENGRVKTGVDLDYMGPEEFAGILQEVSIFARVSPEHKLRIVEALQQQGNVVAMTGDGVNDSPALKKADIGIAMGIAGTDVAKEASEMVLVDDNFATIVAAVEQGRVIYENIRRFVKFSIAGNLGKVGVMLLAPLFGIRVALLPLQLLWLNLLTDGLLGLGMGMEPAEKDTMQVPPRDPAGGLFGGRMIRHLTVVGIVIAVVALGTGIAYFDPANPQDTTWQTMIFTTLAFLQVGQALASRSTEESLFRQGLLSNPTLLIMISLVIGLQLVAVYFPPLEDFFGVVPLSGRDLLICVALGSTSFIAIELEKWVLRRRA